jgi:hypothetical protein
LRPESDIEKQRFEEAEFRWQERQRLRKQAKD